VSGGAAVLIGREMSEWDHPTSRDHRTGSGTSLKAVARRSAAVPYMVGVVRRHSRAAEVFFAAGTRGFTG
jgi:hypothetical protein